LLFAINAYGHQCAHPFHQIWTAGVTIGCEKVWLDLDEDLAGCGKWQNSGRINDRSTLRG
jgi:hypothetical protein